MKKQMEKNNLNGISLFTILIFATFLMSSSSLMAQRGDDPGWPIHENVQENLTKDGGLHTISYTADYQDMLVASTTGYKYLHLSVRGGDGGARINKALISPYKTKGGGGATCEAYFELGSLSDQISQGDLLRFIVGHGGDVNNSHNMEGADGGAGSGVFLKKSGSSKWITLMVAGGGGGAYSDCCTVNSAGRSASTGTSGQDGGGIAGGDGGSNGGSAGSYIHAYGGGGVNDVFKNGEPIGSTDHHSGSYYDYLYGCGNGGDAIGNGPSGGGGGGYSGGGGGATSASGGGGGSYINPNMSTIAKKIYSSSQTNDPKDGHATYKFLAGSALVVGKFESVNNQGYCIGTESASKASGQNLEIVNCNSTTQNLEWTFTGSTITLNNDPQKCLDLYQRNTTPGTNIQLYNCHGGDAQKWLYDGRTQQIRYWTSLEKCISLKSNNLVIADCSDADNQKWSMDYAISMADLGGTDVVSFRLFGKQDYCLDNTGGKTNNGNKIQLWDCGGAEGNNNQKWLIDRYSIRLSNHRNKCLDLTGKNTSTGTAIELYDCNTSPAQEWIYDGVNKVLRYKANLEKCLILDHGNTDNGTATQIGGCNSEKWVMEKATPNAADEAYGPIKMVINSNKCIDLNRTKVSNGSNIQIWDCNGGMAQYWFFDTDKQIKLMKNPDYCLSLASTTGPPNGGNVYLWQCQGQNHQKWIYDATNHLIKSQLNTNKCLDPTGTSQGSNMQVWPCGAGATQKFIF